MSTFMGKLLDSRQTTFKRQKRHHPRFKLGFGNMGFFTQTTQYLSAPIAPTRKRSQRSIRPRDDVDDFLSSDLELSFASTVSLHSPPNPSTLSAEPEYPDAMDVSPAPPAKPSVFKLPSNENTKTQNRPRASTSGARLFGNDLSNGPTNGLLPSPKLIPTPSIRQGSTHSTNKKTTRSALPMEWFTVPNAQQPPGGTLFQPPPPTSPMDDAMEVDSYVVEPVAEAYSRAPPVPHSAAPTTTEFKTLFYQTMSPRRSFESPAGPQTKKRRSLSPEPTRSSEADHSSSPMPSSPSISKFERITSGPMLARLNKPTLQGLGAPTANALKRPRRPALSAMVNPSDVQRLHSAYPICEADDEEPTVKLGRPKGMPPVRRAFSALIPTNMVEPFSDESSFDGPDMSSPAQAYAKRQQVKTIRRCDGTDDFRPLTGATALAMKESPSAKFMSAGMPGFGDNEAYGKILPCHRVSEDGLMRINSQTLDDLIDGKFDLQIADFHVIDCRFDYEYTGGHIPGAANINTTAAVEELLLGPSLTKPRPSTSGDAARKTVLVFHCEFSAKRAPTFAKHLRAKDRAMNNHVYPKIHYPEVYILEGGYCQYFKTSAARCQPPAYVTMDDPTHAVSRREDLDQFRKARFGRHKSYAYGDGTNKGSTQSQQPKRNTAPSGGPNPLFAAATAARTRRGGGGALSTLKEDGNTTADADDTDTDIGDSPCPPPTKNAAFKGKKIGRAPITRAETYGPTRMPY